MTLQFENRHHAVNYYKKELSRVDDELQAYLIGKQKILDQLLHQESLMKEKIANSLREMRELNDLIQFNKEWIKRESKSTLTSFSRGESKLDSPLGYNQEKLDGGN